jgi:hypothetical protein
MVHEKTARPCSSSVKLHLGWILFVGMSLRKLNGEYGVLSPCRDNNLLLHRSILCSATDNECTEGPLAQSHI